jgi:hypothetical protein
VSAWAQLLAQLDKRGPSRELDSEIHAELGMPTYSLRIVPKYGMSTEASQRILLQLGVNWRLQVNDGRAHALAQVGEHWLDRRGEVGEIGRVQCAVMLMVLEKHGGG